MPHAELDGVTLSYEDRGSGPPLLLIPGIPAIASDWEPLAERLGAGRRVIALDNRGSGASTVTPGPYTTRGLAADAVALLDHLDIPRADVFGQSMGGMIAQELALGWPDRIRRLILGCTHCGLAHAAPPSREAGRSFAMQTDDWGERMRAMAQFAFGPDADPALLESVIEKKSRDVQDPDGYSAQLAAVFAHDTYDRLPEIGAPTLVITGDHDEIIPAICADPLAQRIPDARLHVLPGAGHLFFLERLDDTVAVVEAFLDADYPHDPPPE